MATIGLQCNGLSQIHSGVYFRLKIVLQVVYTYIGKVLIEVNILSMQGHLVVTRLLVARLNLEDNWAAQNFTGLISSQRFQVYVACIGNLVIGILASYACRFFIFLGDSNSAKQLYCALITGYQFGLVS